MPVDIQITKDDIQYAESILLQSGKTFDEERIAFITNLQTIDLQAVPGSGKTTALLAKLLILERKLPFPNGSGILVISHTNAAVDEIKHKIAKYCPKLFSYPNFVGTIQSFVNEFLAKPCGHNLLNVRLSWIDSDTYSTEILSSYKSIKWDTKFDKPNGIFYSKYLLQAMSECCHFEYIAAYPQVRKNEIENIIKSVHRLRSSLRELVAESNRRINAMLRNKLGNGIWKQDVAFLFESDVKETIELYTETTVSSMYYDYIENCIRYDDGTILIKRINGKKQENKKCIGLKTAVEMVLKKGIISYRYAYHLAEYYLYRYPDIFRSIQKRFSYVFVDEMQDMDKHQHDLLEKLFFDSGNSLSTYQRIGDRNQAIYSGYVKADNYWIDRILHLGSDNGIWQRVLRIEGSHRLSPQVASIVQHFSLDSSLRINGLREEDIRPRMILYNSETISNIVPMFANIIQSLQQERKIPYQIANGQKPSFHTVAWSTVWPEQKNHPDKLRLTDFVDFAKVANDKNRANYDALKCYFEFWDRQSQSLAPIQKNLLNALLRIVRFEGVKNREYGKEREFTRNTLMKFLYRNHPNFYELLKQKLYKWCIALIHNNQEQVFVDLKDFTPLLIEKLGGTSSLSTQTHTFINNPCPEAIRTAEGSRAKSNYNVKQYGDIEIKIGSVHSVKGQTHTATLYIESYHGTGPHPISEGYESYRLAGCFNQDGQQIESGVNQQSAKMVYVGFSRPTHLLCFAVHKDRYATLNCDEYWDIHDLTAETAEAINDE